MTSSAANWPDAVILLGSRAWLSLVAILCLALGHWRSERQWDDQGAAVYDQEDAEDAYSRLETDSASLPPPPPPMPEVMRSIQHPPSMHGRQQQPAGPPRSAWSDWTKNLPVISMNDRSLSVSWPDVNHQEELPPPPPPTTGDKVERVSRVMEQAWPISKVTITGWILLAVSSCLDRASWFTWEVSRPLVGVNLLLIGFLAIVQAVWLRRAMLRRVVHQDSYFLAACWIGCLCLEGILTSLLDPDAPWFAAPIGATCVALSTVVMWWSRKMGYSFDVYGEPNRRAAVYTIGGPLAAGGWLFFWMGMNAVHATPDSAYLPLFWSGRTVLSFLAAAMVTLVLFAMNHAHDEQEDKGTEQGGTPVRDYYALDFPSFGRFEKFKTALALAWLLWGSTVLIPYMVGVIPIFILILCVGMGVVLGLFHDQAVRKGDPAALKMYSVGIGGLLLVWWLLLTLVAGKAASFLSLIGFVSAVVGAGLLHGDAKRGKVWMLTRKIQHNATVYSYGAILFPLGLFLVAWAMSFP